MADRTGLVYKVYANLDFLLIMVCLRRKSHLCDHTVWSLRVRIASYILFTFQVLGFSEFCSDVMGSHEFSVQLSHSCSASLPLQLTFFRFGSDK